MLCLGYIWLCESCMCPECSALHKFPTFTCKCDVRVSSQGDGVCVCVSSQLLYECIYFLSTKDLIFEPEQVRHSDAL